jgi:hypothetical protein
MIIFDKLINFHMFAILEISESSRWKFYEPFGKIAPGI